MITANGSKAKIQWCAELLVGVGEVKVGGVRFYVVEGVPAEVVIGNTSMAKFGMMVDWKHRRIFSDVGGRRELPWRKKGQQYWRHPITLITDSDYDIPSGCQMVVGVNKVDDEEFRGYSEREGMITPLRTKARLDQKFMVGHGYGEMKLQRFFFPTFYFFSIGDTDSRTSRKTGVCPYL